MSKCARTRAALHGLVCSWIHSTLIFTISLAICKCPLDGCPEPSPYVADDGFDAALNDAIASPCEPVANGC